MGKRQRGSQFEYSEKAIEITLKKVFHLTNRGTATVRSLANFIHYFGVLPKSHPELIKQACDIYKDGREERASSHVESPQN